MALPLLLSVYYRYRYYRTAGPSSTGYPNIRTSAGYPFYCTGTAVYFALVVDPRRGGFVGWDPCCCNQQS